MFEPPRYQRARLVRRYKRFLADVELESGESLTVHCPNPGRMIGVQEAGSEVCLRDSRNSARKLRWTLQSIRVGAIWVNLDTHLANPFVEARVRAGELPELAGYAELRREVRYGEGSRIDLLLEDPERDPCYVEVKSTTLLEEGVARFPDAVTARGLEHLRELARMKREGARAVLVFLVGREDAHSFEPADHIDPTFGAALREVAAEGVELFAYAARGGPEELRLAHSLDVHLPILDREAPTS